MTFTSFITSTSIPLRIRQTRSPHTVPRTCATAQPTPSSTQPTPPTSQPRFALTSLANNTFILQHETTTLLIDPWLYDDLVFLTPPFFRSKKPAAGKAAAASLDISSVSAIILTQALADHAHPPTLQRLPKNIPVICPNSATPLLTQLRFQTVTPLQFGQTLKLFDTLSITGIKGSLVGPPWSEPQLGMIFQLRDQNGSTSIYHEPHGNHDEPVLQKYRGKLDAVMAPVVSTKIPALGNYALVNGVPEAVRLCQVVKPRKVVLFDNSGGEQTGFLTKYLKSEGSVQEFERLVGTDVEVVLAAVGERILI